MVCVKSFFPSYFREGDPCFNDPANEERGWKIWIKYQF